MGKPIICFISSAEHILPVVRNKIHLLYSEASIENEFRIELNYQIKLAIEAPGKLKVNIVPKIQKAKAFISYSHVNKAYLDRLKVHLKPLERNCLLDVWVDTRIKSGDKWKEKTDKALSEANIAILMISADFMASDFIIDNELAPLLSQAEVKGTKIVPVILSHCRFSRDPSLSRFQAVNSPAEPLSEMNYNEKEAVYDKLAKDIELALENPGN